MLDYLIVIPARYNSTRFPGKPLAKINGKELILHVIERCLKITDKKNIVVATDNFKIKNFVAKKKYKAILTSKKCLTGTDRVAEISKKIKANIYVNVQGDEPLVNPIDIKRIIEIKKKNMEYVICGMTKLNKDERVDSFSIPKVIFDKKLFMIYISRSIIPSHKLEKKINNSEYWKQVCIYAFSKENLKYYGKNKVKNCLEDKEDIELLRFLNTKYKIKMVKTSPGSVAVDFPKDIKLVEKILNEKKN